MNTNGLTKQAKPSNFVEPLRGEVLPPARPMPVPTDPYAMAIAPVQQVVKYESSPEQRARAMVMKVHQVTVALAVLTAAALYGFGQFYLFWWLIAASAEWVAVFVVLAIIDYRETPSAQQRHQTDRLLDMMDREQRARLRHQYGEGYDG